MSSGSSWHDDNENDEELGPYEASWEPGMARKILKEFTRQRKKNADAHRNVTTNEEDRQPPFLVGLVGVAGSGSTVSAFLMANLLEEAGYPTMVLPHDGYHYPLDILRNFPNAEDAIYRRGAPVTLDPYALVRDLRRIKRIVDEDRDGEESSTASLYGTAPNLGGDDHEACCQIRYEDKGSPDMN